MKSIARCLPPLLPWLITLALFLCEPASANKFETIGGGVQGSAKIKIEYLHVIAYFVGAIFLAAGILSIVLHDKNAQTLNYTMWKTSSALFFLLSVASFAVAILMGG